MKRKLLLAGLSAIVIASFLEITFYFVYIFKPIDRLAGKDIGVPRGIPTTSEMFTSILLNQYITQADESKTFYSQRLDDFTQELKSVMLTKSSFVKLAEANYTVAGTVQVIKTTNDVSGGIFPGYDIILKNSSGGEMTEHLSPSEAQYAQVTLITIKLGNLYTEKKALTDISVKDYLVIKRSTNLLNPKELNIEIEILRTVK